MELFDKKAKESIGRYVLQCALATASILVTLIFINLFTYTTIIASLGATTFIVFTMPSSYPARPRSLTGGYLTGIVIGAMMHLIANLLLTNFFPNYEHIIFTIFGALSVGLSIFIMVVTDAEHPPAAGLALGLVLSDWTYMTLFFVFSAVLIMLGLKKLLKPYLLDLR
ncbi:HPP family protein [Caldisalinibacter kiritimatiensis]|uniref:Putative membrane protein n=1 Tax=Caldisalinibacter kiritimatiensis TaxID=1304284 RepID=R1CEG7_9FIRM|nr:HPP family protein [Caldisalinibacter kiritimatiensis]EOD00690.1 Putative membrane protein [Caldisalinibacter kiritimatiensis]